MTLDRIARKIGSAIGPFSRNQMARVIAMFQGRFRIIFTCDLSLV